METEYNSVLSELNDFIVIKNLNNGSSDVIDFQTLNELSMLILKLEKALIK
ncbi:MAG: hypothetical protein M0R03_14885 [Novosphingobium sp.]|nr:hypothetical protein [Novosphingobium sp.]